MIYKVWQSLTTTTSSILLNPYPLTLSIWTICLLLASHACNADFCNRPSVKTFLTGMLFLFLFSSVLSSTYQVFCPFSCLTHCLGQTLTLNTQITMYFSLIALTVIANFYSPCDKLINVYLYHWNLEPWRQQFEVFSLYYLYQINSWYSWNICEICMRDLHF